LIFAFRLGPEIWDHRIVSEEDLKREEEEEPIDSVVTSPILARTWKNRSYTRKNSNSLEQSFKTLDDADDFLDDMFK